MSLHRESHWPAISPLERELRRRLWWALVVIDVRGCEDRGSEPTIFAASYNTKQPLNINDADIDLETEEPIRERTGFTEMTKTSVTYIVSPLAEQLAYETPYKDDQSQSFAIRFEKKEKIILDVENRLEKEVLLYCDQSKPIAWVTSVVIRLVMARIRLALYHPPLQDLRSTSQRFVSREKVLRTAIEAVEYSHLLDSEPSASQWTWFFNTHPQWHALAATLAELCVQDQGPLVERAWKIVDVVFDRWSARVADSRDGLLWRPMKKLMSKAQAKRNEAKQRSSGVTIQQQSLPDFGIPPLTNLQAPDPVATSYSTGFAESNRSFDQEHGPPSDILSTLNVNDTLDTINWTEWDEFMQDFEMQDQPIEAPQDMSRLGTWVCIF